MGNAAAAADEVRKPQRIGTRLQWNGIVTMSGSYATGGDTLSAKALGMAAITGGIMGSRGANAYEVLPQANGDAKIKAVVMSTGAEVANATNLSAIALQAQITGR